MAQWMESKILHGGDYNPDQWRHMPGIVDEDMRLMKLAGCDLMSVGIFAWAALEPEEGVFTFEWLDEVLDQMARNGVYAILATPSGARPAWMSQKYPEVLRVTEDGVRNLHGGRHNHCYTSPIYREKVNLINTKLAERYGRHPAVKGWHISNEYNGECFCPLCQEEFRKWLKAKYGTIEKLNQSWWTGFWSHTYTDFSQIEPPMKRGEVSVHGLNLDWKRFCTDRTVDFMRAEIAPIRALCPELPVTTNMMGTFEGLDYHKFRDVLDIASWDSYPAWRQDESDADLAIFTAMSHDLMRGIKRKPFLLMESVPSATNWFTHCKLKRPGMHKLSSLLAVAQGADSVQYFQWRKSRGSSEKLHGAVVDHVGNENTRVFGDVAELGQILQKFEHVAGAETRSQAALLYDWENRWALENAQGMHNDDKGYLRIVQDHYAALKAQGIDVDVIDPAENLDAYKLVVAPSLYMLKPGFSESIRAFVRRGGVFVATPMFGMVDENDLCFLGGFPGPLRDVMGIWNEELDALYPGESNGIVEPDGTEWKCGFLCERIHPEGAEVLARYTEDFYAGEPALTRHAVGEGWAYYLATCTERAHLNDFYHTLVKQCGIERLLQDETTLPAGVIVSSRQKGDIKTLFCMNFTPKTVPVHLKRTGKDALCGGETGAGICIIEPFDLKIIQYLC